MYVLNTCSEEAYRITRVGFIKISHSPTLTAISAVRPSHHNKEKSKTITTLPQKTYKQANSPTKQKTFYGLMVQTILFPSAEQSVS